MPDITSFRDLVAWQRAMDLAHSVYVVTEDFPARERFGLASQMRRAAVSIPSNIAEGHRRRRPGYAQFLVVALGSHGELDTQCELATRCGYLTADQGERLNRLLDDVGRLTHGLLRSLSLPNR